MAINKEDAFRLIERLQPIGVYELMKATPESRAATQATIKELCDYFSSANPTDRADIASHIRDSFSCAFFWFARSMAENSVRESSPEAIWDGLMALVIENFVFDYRDSLMRLVLLYHSAIKLGLDTETLFARAASLAVNPKVAEQVRNFPLRRPGARSLSAFLYGESGEGATFAYRKFGGEDRRF
jgi:hypothetical protein